MGRQSCAAYSLSARRSCCPGTVRGRRTVDTVVRDRPDGEMPGLQAICIPVFGSILIQRFEDDCVRRAPDVVSSMDNVGTAGRNVE